MRRKVIVWGLVIGISLLALGLVGGCQRLRKTESVKSDKYGNYYEIFVGSFCDSNGDGIGDLGGITEKLDYLKDLGVDGLWLTPIMPSKDYHKYSVIDYKAIDPDFGTMEDFDQLVAEANKRDMKIVLDLVLNHSSSSNPWFVSAKESLQDGTPNNYADYYNFVKGDQAQQEGYHSLGIGDYAYEGVFNENMPDLNMDCEALRGEVQDIAAFWIQKGVAGFRLDAAKYIHEDEVQTIQFWKWFGDYCRTLNPDFYLVGEVWSSGGTIETYYQSGIDSFFNFPFSQANGSIVTAVRQKNGAGFVQGMCKWQSRIKGSNPQAIDATFLSNHDQDRIFGVLGKKLEQQKMATSLYLMMPGNGFVYYGEEIGMLGDTLDPDRRAPMVWSSKADEGIPDPPPGTGKLITLDQGVEEQLKDPDSLLNFYKKALKLRHDYPEIARGTVAPIDLQDRNLGAYEVSYEGEQLIIIHNLGSESKTFECSKKMYSYEKIQAQLCSGKEKAALKKEMITIPPRSTIILK